MNTAEHLRNRLWDAREAASFLKVSRSWIYARGEPMRCRTFGSAGYPFRPFPTPRLGIHEGSHEGLTWRASTRREDAGLWWLRFKGADGRWQGAPAKARTKPAARLEALERERLPRQEPRG